MTDQRDTPDTRTPSAEGCGHPWHAEEGFALTDDPRCPHGLRSEQHQHPRFHHTGAVWEPCDPLPEPDALVDDLRRQVAAARGALASIEYNARSALATLDRGSFNREDASLRADYEWFATTAGAALDTAAEDRRPEDGYGTDNVPGGWGGPGSQETRDR